MATQRKGEIVIDLCRKDGESVADYHRRLVYGKLVDKTLADADYSELAEHLYGKRYASDVARRMIYGSRHTLELIDNERVSGIEDNDIATSCDAKIAELKRERQKFFDQRREYNKIITKDARSEHLIDSLIRSADALRDSVGNMFCASHNDDGSRICTTCDNEAVLVLSDWHYGMTADNAFNTYNTDICRDRIRHVAEMAAARLRTHGCGKLHIVVLGDLFHGAIHASARVASEELVCDQLMQSSEILAQTIDFLSSYVPETYVYVTYGNHARTVQIKAENIHRDNMERIIPWWLEQRLRENESVKVVPDNGTEFLFISAAGHEFCASHGDNDTVKDAPKLLSTLCRKKFGIDIEYILLGDKHHRESFNELGITSLLCGSLCGVDDYANNKRLYSDPSQLLLIVNDACGVDAEYRLKCE